MKYKLISRNDTFVPIETVLENRGITKDLFDLNKSVVEDYNNYDNIIEGVELLLKHLKNDSNIAMIVDPDVDGLCSFTILYRYIKELYPNIKIEILIHKGKQHGLSDDIKIKDNINLVVLTDASSNDYSEHRKLKEKGIDVLVVD